MPITQAAAARGIAMQVLAFLQAVANHTAPVVTGQDGLAVMAVIDAAYQSAYAQSQSVLIKPIAD